MAHKTDTYRMLLGPRETMALPNGLILSNGNCFALNIVTLETQLDRRIGTRRNRCRRNSDLTRNSWSLKDRRQNVPGRRKSAK